MSTEAGKPAPRVALFVTCLIDLFRPQVGFATLSLLEEAGCQVTVPEAQTCCGQPAYNSGARAEAAAIARQVVTILLAYDYIVVPSGSCAGMLKKHYPALLSGDEGMAKAAEDFAARVYELTAFLSDVLKVDYSGRVYNKRLTYHDSCSSFREMGVAAQPRRLLQSLDGVTMIEMEDRDVCCGFGGTFSVKYPDISNAMVEQKSARALETGTQVLAGGDLGCLMNIAGKLARKGVNMEVRHIAEILSGMTRGPGIASRS